MTHVLILLFLFFYFYFSAPKVNKVSAKTDETINLIIMTVVNRKNVNLSNTNCMNPHMRQQEHAGRRIWLMYVTFLCVAASCLLISSGYLTGAQNRTIHGVITSQHQASVLKPDKHEVGQNQIQVSHATAKNRYPDEYRAARDYLRAHHSSSRESGYRLLSFGSSTGEEAITLATLYFPNDDANIGSKTVLFGVDIDQETVSTAEASWLAATTTDDGKVIPKSKVTFFNGQNTSISEHGPYDAIFANSILCSHPPDKGAKGVLQRFSFEQFESSLEYLDGNLKVGGLLAIVNTNYHFSRSKFSKRYTPLETKCKNFVPKVDVESAIFEPNGELFLADCVWVKNDTLYSSNVSVSLYNSSNV